MSITYSNPRTEATIKDWPHGRNRVTARFWIESHPKRGERVCRQTTGKPKKLTYSKRFAIVDGDDGRTYLIYDTSPYSFLGVMQGNMKYQEETVHPEDGERYEELAALLDAREGEVSS